LQLKTFESAERKVKLMLGRAPPLQPDGYRDYEIGHDWDKAAAARAFGETQSAAASVDPPNFAAPTLLGDFFAALPAETQVVLVFLPRHISSLPPADSGAARLEGQCKAAYHVLAAARRRTVIVDLAVAGDIARNDQFFWDKVHYRGPVATRVEDAVVSALQAEESN
jgi:hypothetical protein